MRPGGISWQFVYLLSLTCLGQRAILQGHRDEEAGRELAIALLKEPQGGNGMKKTIMTLTSAVFAATVAFAPIANADCGSCGASSAKDAKHDHKHSIYETAQEAGFKTLVAAVDAAGLDETLKNEGPFTVFAPTEEAFAALPEGALEGLLKDKDALTKVLLYHVVAGKVMAKDVVKMKSAEMLNGVEANIKVKKDTVMIAGVKVIKTDIVAANGIIHVIDAVMLPKGDEAGE
jgi:uncharacterized surface protein with fasciclin (FAS1) repeats